MKSFLMFLIAFVMVAPAISAQKLTAEEIIAKHLDSIATAEKRASVKTVIASGEVKFESIAPKNQPAAGRIVLASEGSKSMFGMQLNAADYPRELVIFDGSKANIAMVRAGNRSVLGNFLQSNSSVVSQGLLAGTLGTSWNLLTAADRGAKISTSGTKKIEGRETYILRVTPKGGSDLDIKMYFDQETFRHVRTEYGRTSSASIGRTIDESARQSETKIRVIEDFSDHQPHDGMTFPRKYKLHYSTTGQNTTEIVWTAVFTEFALNQAFDPSTFSVGP